jgi:hypothetical protein
MQALIATLQCGAREFQGIVQQIAHKLLDAYWVGECRDGTIGATKLKFNTFLLDRREKRVDSALDGTSQVNLLILKLCKALGNPIHIEHIVNQSLMNFGRTIYDLECAALLIF